MLRALDRLLAPVTWIVAAIFIVLLLIGPKVVAEDSAKKAAQYSPAGADGAQVFKANCATCHTLSAAGASGQVGPNLDDSTLSAAQIEAVVKAGPGAMPSFEGQLSAAEITAVAKYVESSR